jgi:hypothetical protein
MTNYDALAVLENDYEGTAPDNYDALEVLARLEMQAADWL